MSEEQDTYAVKETEDVDVLKSQKEALRLTILTASAYLDLGKHEAAQAMLKSSLINVW